MKNKSILLAMLIATGTAHPATIEVWECKDTFGDWSEIIAEARVNEERKTGEITVAGVTHKTVFDVDGFERRWDFGLRKNGSYTYAFIVGPSGDGRYYNFGRLKSTNPSILMNCRQRNLKSFTN